MNLCGVGLKIQNFNINKKMIDLKNVTLIGIDGRPKQDELDLLIKIAKNSLKFINFGKVKILTGLKDFKNNDSSIEILYANIPSYEEYSRFCVKKLNEYIDTDFCLIYHTDGFIINPHLWTDEFLHYDYIGAPWPPNWNQSDKRVGNGGFCLRSKKFLEESSKLNYISGNEDWQLCCIFDGILKSNGIKFAPIELASKFSLELDTEFNTDINKVFGFHGRHHGRDIDLINKM